jgi:hypothetical protein
MGRHKEMPGYFFEEKYKVDIEVTVKCIYLTELVYTLLDVEDL